MLKAKKLSNIKNQKAILKENLRYSILHFIERIYYSDIVKIMVGYVIVILLTVLFFELTSFFVLKLNNFSNVPVPWDAIVLLFGGFKFSALLASLFSSLIFYSAYLIYLGGVERSLGKTIFMGFIVFVLVNSFALGCFNFWHSEKLPLYPWISYQLLVNLPLESTLWQNYCLCLFVSAVTCLVSIAAIKLPAWLPSHNVFGKAHFASSFETKKAGLFSEQGIILGKAHGKILRLGGFEGVLVTAPTGAGKTTAIAVPNLLEWQGSGIFNDLKGELYALTASYRKEQLKNHCYCWSPATADKKTDRYNPFFYVSSNPDLQIRDLQLIAETLIPAERVDGGFWYTSSRDIFILLAVYLIETKGTATLAEIHDISKEEDFFNWLELEVLDQTINNPVFYQNAQSLINADAEKTRKNILKDFHSRMTLFNDPLIRHATSGNDFDLRNLRKQKISIYLNIPDADKERLKSILTLFWAQCIHLLTEHAPTKEEPYAVLALLDEFGNMARINKLREGMSFLRSYNIRPIVIVQYLAQILSAYGQHDAKGFLNSKVKIAFALNDIDDAKFFSQGLGQKTVKVKSMSASVGQHESSARNTSFQGKALMTADEIMQMKETDEIILLEAQSPVKAKKCYWFKEGRYRKLLSKKMPSNNTNTAENSTHG